MLKGSLGPVMLSSHQDRALNTCPSRTVGYRKARLLPGELRGCIQGPHMQHWQMPTTCQTPASDGVDKEQCLKIGKDTTQ